MAAMDNMSQRIPADTFGRQMLNKAREISLYFWVIHVLCSTVVETFADLRMAICAGHQPLPNENEKTLK